MINQIERSLKLLLALIRGEVLGEEIPEETWSDVDEELLVDLYRLSKHHDVAHIAASGLKKAGQSQNNELFAKYEKQKMLALYRYEQSRYELNALGEVLEAENIPFMPLKGSVLRAYYPEPWMRTSCDIDVLVRREDGERAVAALSKGLQYRKETTGSHDFSLFSPSGVHVELHFSLNEEAYRTFDTLTNIWEYAKPAEGCACRYEMSDEAFYFYHIAHMAKHFEIGGCGMRSFLDLWILSHRVEHDERARNALLEREGLLAFSDGCRRLSETWFSGTEGDRLTDSMQSYILDGGVYGSIANKVTIQQSKQGGKLRYAMRRIFMPYDTLKVYYPILQKKKWLMPFMEVHRWLRLLLSGKARRSIRELNVSRGVSDGQVRQAENILSQLGLK
ncbi:MAG: nucleotidyltransferase family protein [Clostridia bacterium]|nr:nucleotidyltransferase family protein [Clostridia bacterium]